MAAGGFLTGNVVNVLPPPPPAPVLHHGGTFFSVDGNLRMLRIRAKAQNDLVHMDNTHLTKLISVCEQLSWLMQGTVLAGICTQRIGNDSVHIHTSFKRFETLRTMVTEAAISTAIHTHAYEHYRPGKIKKEAQGGMGEGAGAGAGAGAGSGAGGANAMGVGMGTFDTNNTAIIHGLVKRLERSMSILEQQAQMTEQNDISLIQDLIRACASELRISKSIRSGINKHVASLVWFTILDFAQHMPLTTVIPLIGQELDARRLLNPIARTIAIVNCVKAASILVIPPQITIAAATTTTTATATASAHTTRARTPAPFPQTHAGGGGGESGLFRFTKKRASMGQDQPPSSPSPSAALAVSSNDPHVKVPMIFKHAHLFDYTRLTRDILTMMAMDTTTLDLTDSPTPKMLPGMASVGTVRSFRIMSGFMREKLFVSKTIQGYNAFEPFASLPDDGVDPFLMSPGHPYLAHRTLCFAMTNIFRGTGNADNNMLSLRYCGTLEGIIEGLATEITRPDSVVRLGHMGNSVSEPIKKYVIGDGGFQVSGPAPPHPYHPYFTTRSFISLIKKKKNKDEDDVLLRFAPVSPATTIHTARSSPPPPEEEESAQEPGKGELIKARRLSKGKRDTRDHEGDRPGSEQDSAGDVGDDDGDGDSDVDDDDSGSDSDISALVIAADEESKKAAAAKANTLTAATGNTLTAPTGNTLTAAAATTTGGGAGAGGGAAGGADTVSESLIDGSETESETKAAKDTVYMHSFAGRLVHKSNPMAVRIYDILADEWTRISGISESDIGTVMFSADGLPDTVQGLPVVVTEFDDLPAGACGVACVGLLMGTTKARLIFSAIRPIFSKKLSPVGKLAVKTKNLGIRTFSSFCPLIPPHCSALLGMQINPRLSTDRQLTLAEFLFAGILQEATLRGFKVVAIDASATAALPPKTLPIITGALSIHEAMLSFVNTSLVVNTLSACANVTMASCNLKNKPFQVPSIHIFKCDFGWGAIPVWYGAEGAGRAAAAAAGAGAGAGAGAWDAGAIELKEEGALDWSTYFKKQLTIEMVDDTVWPHRCISGFLKQVLETHVFIHRPIW